MAQVVSKEEMDISVSFLIDIVPWRVAQKQRRLHTSHSLLSIHALLSCQAVLTLDAMLTNPALNTSVSHNSTSTQRHGFSASTLKTCPFRGHHSSGSSLRSKHFKSMQTSAVAKYTKITIAENHKTCLN